MARKTDGATVSPPPLTDQQVADYLRTHPDFLARHGELLAVLDPPLRWHSDRVVDLQAAMVVRLRAEVDQIKGTAEHLIHTSRSNMSTQTRTHRSVLALLAAESLAGLVQAVADDLPALLDVDVATLCFEESAKPIPALAAAGILRIPANAVEKAMGGRDRDCALNQDVPGDPMLFGSGAGLVASSAIARLTPGGTCPEGVMALGSRQGRAFQTGQGTELLAFLARVVEGCVRRFVG